MLYLAYSETNKDTLSRNLGAAEYSYFFVREYFEWMLERFGNPALPISDPDAEADRHFEAAQPRGEPCLLLSFAPPHRSFIDIACPTMPIFAWEFDTLPNEIWDDNPRNDWRMVLTKFGAAITHSRYSLDAIKRAMGADFPVLAVPAPVFDRINESVARISPARELVVSEAVLDTRRPETWALPEAAPAATELNEVREERASAPPKGLKERIELTAFYLVSWYRDAVRDLMPLLARKSLASFGRSIGRLLRPLRHVPTPDAPPEGGAPKATGTNARSDTRIDLDGVVYTAVFNPRDGRKNWEDIFLAFCVAHAEHDDATLVLKFATSNPEFAYEILRDNLRKLPPFRCRVIALSAFFDEETYCRLVDLSTYVVNASRSEGQCLPVMEFMSAGKPAIAPRNTALADYIDEDVAFIVKDNKELCCWPQDVRNMYRAHRYRIDWQSLVEAFDASYQISKERPEQYRRMSANAIARMRGFCSQQVVWDKFSAFVNLLSEGTRCESRHAEARIQRRSAGRSG